MHFFPVGNCGISTHLQHSISKQSACAGIPPSRRHSYAPSETRKSPNQSLQGFCPLPHQPNVPGSSDSPSSSSSASWWGWPWSFSWRPSGGSTSHPHAAVSVGIGSNPLGSITKKDVYRPKDLSLMKVENLATSGAEYPGWKNTFLTRVASIDQTGNDTILAWLSKCFNNEKGWISQIVVFFLG